MFLFMNTEKRSPKSLKRVGILPNLITMFKSVSIFLLFALFLCSTAIGQLPVWPLVTGFAQTGAVPDLISTTPHQFVDWTTPAPSSTNIPGPLAVSNRVGPTQAGIDGCNNLVFFTLHNGNFPAATSFLQLFTPGGVYMPLPGGDMNANAGDDEVQIIRRPGYANQWFLVYSLAPAAFPSGHPGYQSSFLAYSLIEISGITASYVLDGSLVPIKDRILDAGGTNFRYFQGKATSRTSFTGNHDIYAQRRTQASGSATISTTFQIDRFEISGLDAITYSGSSPIVNGYSFGLMASGSPIELSPTEDRLAVMARTQTNNEQQIYTFDISTPTSFTTSTPTTITISDLEIQFATAPAPLTGTSYQANLFDSPQGTTVEWLKNFERKISGLEFSPNGQYLYISGGGYVAGSTTNITYLGQIDLNSTSTPSGNNPIRLQVQAPPGALVANTGAGNTWTAGNFTNYWGYHGITSLQSCFDGNLYFTKVNSEQLWVLPNPDLPMPINMTPGTIDFGTVVVPNVPTNGFVQMMPDQIDGFDYTANNYTSVTFNASNQSLCTCDTLSFDVVNVATGDVFTSLFIDGCPSQFTICVEEDEAYNFVGSNGIVFNNAIVSGNLAFPLSGVFNFGNGSATGTSFTTVTTTLITTNEAWDGKYFVPDNTIVTVDGAELDLTNVDIVFGECSGFDFINGAHLRANNSVFRPCNIQRAWRGFYFRGESQFDNIINESTFKNAETTLHFENSDGVISNNLFSNCNQGVRITNQGQHKFNHPISGNRFVYDDFYPQFTLCNSFTDPNLTYGVIGSNAEIDEISHNEFIYSVNTPGIVSRGVDLSACRSFISENTFTNIRNAIISNSPVGQTQLENNEIEYNGDFVWTATSPATPAGGISIYGSSGSAVHVVGNEIYTHNTTNDMYGVYAQKFSNLSVRDNFINNFTSGIYLFDGSASEVSSNEIKECERNGIYFRQVNANAVSGNTYITCNDVTMSYATGVGIWVENGDKSVKITNNCVKDATTAIQVSSGTIPTTIPYIRNNYLYNYRNGIYNVGHSGNIGTSGDPGLNTLWSNNSSSIDIASTSSISAADNFGMFTISFPQVSISSNFPYHSTASCGHQIFNMPSQGNLNTTFICDNGTGVNGAFLNDNGELKDQYLTVIRASVSPIDDAIALIHAYNGADISFINELVAELAFDSNDAELLKYYLFAKGGNLTNAQLALTAYTPIDATHAQMKGVNLIGLNALQGNDLSSLEISSLQDIVIEETDLSNTASAILRMTNNSHPGYTFKNSQSPDYDENMETLTIETDIVSMRLFPNPTDGLLNIAFIANNESNAEQVNIFNATGELLITQSLDVLVGEIQVDVSSLSNGFYIITVNSSDETLAASRFVKK